MWLWWCIHTFKGNVTVNNTAAEGAPANNTNKKKWYLKTELIY